VRRWLNLVAARGSGISQNSLDERRGDAISAMSEGNHHRVNQHGWSAVVRHVGHHHQCRSPNHIIIELREVRGHIESLDHAFPSVTLNVRNPVGRPTTRAPPAVHVEYSQ
jgi:hypothetical protein